MSSSSGVMRHWDVPPHGAWGALLVHVPPLGLRNLTKWCGEGVAPVFTGPAPVAGV